MRGEGREAQEEEDEEAEDKEQEDEDGAEEVKMVGRSLRLSTENAMRRWQRLQELVAAGAAGVAAGAAVGVAAGVVAGVAKVAGTCK